MQRAKLVLAAVAVITLSLTAAPKVEAHSKCPDGTNWDAATKKCVHQPRGSFGG